MERCSFAGCQTFTISQETESEPFCLLSVAQRRPQSSNALSALRKAIDCWERDEKALAHIHLAFARLGTVETPEDAWRLFLADELIVAGMTPRELAKAINFPLPMSSLSRYDPEQPRNPAGGGRVSGQWTKTPSAGPSAARFPTPLAAAPSLTETLGAGALEWLARFVGRLSLPAALFGAVFVPSPNPGTSGSGAVPGHPGLNYQLDRDTGILRLSLESDPDPEHALVAQLSPDGVYRDVETKVAIARAVGSNAVIIDLDLAPDLAPEAAKRPVLPDDRPKLCPAPAKDQGGGRKLFDILYEQYVRNFVNPQRQPQLPPGLAFALQADTPSGWVHYDDCREADGTMIDAKGHYADFLSTPWGQGKLELKWLDQADRQLSGTKDRLIDWYFHEESTAAFARGIFSTEKYKNKIRVHLLPYPGGIPRPNPRVR